MNATAKFSVWESVEFGSMVKGSACEFRIKPAPPSVTLTETAALPVL